MYKKILAILMVVVLCFSFAACSSEGGDGHGSSEKNPLINVTVGAPDVASSYMFCVVNDSFANSIKYFNIGENSAITADDIRWYVARSEYATLLGSKYFVTNATEEGSGTSRTVTVSLADKANAENSEMKVYKITLNMVLSDDNEWCVTLPSDFVKYKIGVPSGTILTVNGIEMKKCVKNSNFDEYEISCAGKKQNFEVSVPGLGMFSKEITPYNNEKCEYYHCDVTNEEIGKKLLNQIKDDINKINREYVGNTLDRSSIAKYFDESKTPDALEAIISEIKEGFKASTGTYTSITATSVSVPQNYNIYVYSDDTITVNYEMKYTKPHSMSILGVETLVDRQWVRYKKQKDGTWRICDYHEGLFNYDKWHCENAGMVGNGGYYTGTFTK